MRRIRRLAVTGLALAAVTAGAGVPAAMAAPAPATSYEAQAAYDPTAVRNILTVLPDGTTEGGLVRVAGAGLHTPWTGTGGQVAADARFPIGSVSKIFTGAVVLQLVAEHRIGLDDPVRRHLPDLIPAAYSAVTVRQLLNHTSDFPMAVQAPGDPRALVTASFAADTHTPNPGVEQQYNGLNAFVLGFLIERTTGHTYEHELQRRVLRPWACATRPCPPTRRWPTSGPKAASSPPPRTSTASRRPCCAAACCPRPSRRPSSRSRPSRAPRRTTASPPPPATARAA